MAYDLQGIRERVLNDKLDDPTYNTYIIDRFINDAQKSIFNLYELPFMEVVSTDNTISEGDFTFELPDDYQVLQSLKIVDPTAQRRDISSNYLRYKQFNQAFPVPEVNAQGQPTMWTIYGGLLYFSSPVDQDYGLELYYIKKPDDLAEDDDVPEVPSEFEELMVLGAYYRVLERNEDFDLASFYKNGDYSDELDKLAVRYGKKQINGPTIVAQPLRMGYSRCSGRR